METKKLRIELDEVKVVIIRINLGKDFENYMSKFLALKNHERETKDILEVRNFYNSNNVCVTFLIEETEDEKEEVEKCKDWVSQFGELLGEPEVETAYILDKDYNGISSALDYKDLYIYD